MQLENNRFLTFSEWEGKYGEKYTVPKYTPQKGALGVNVDRCKKISATKNSKIRLKNEENYRKYFDEFAANNNLLLISGESDFGEDLFEEMIKYVQRSIGANEAIKLLELSGKYFKSLDGKWIRK